MIVYASLYRDNGLLDLRTVYSLATMENRDNFHYIVLDALTDSSLSKRLQETLNNTLKGNYTYLKSEATDKGSQYNEILKRATSVKLSVLDYITFLPPGSVYSEVFNHEAFIKTLEEARSNNSLLDVYSQFFYYRDDDLLRSVTKDDIS